MLGKKVEDWVPEWREFTLGLSFGNLTARPTIGIQLDPTGGRLRIVKVVEGSGAEKAGIKAEDLVSAAEGQNIATFDELQEILASKKRGDPVLLKVTRSGAEIEVKVALQ